MREMKEKKKKIMENLCEIFFYFLLINKILYFWHRSDLLSVIREDEVYRYKTSTRIIARATKRWTLFRFIC